MESKQGQNERNSEMYSFFATAVHDLKAPLANISGFANALLDGTIPEENSRHYLEIIASEAKRVNALALDIIDFARFEAMGNDPEISSFDVRETIGNVLVSLEQLIIGKALNVDFNFDDECLVKGNKIGIHRVIYNLCHNAIKFSFYGGDLRISVTPAENNYLIEVYNTGSGIEQENLPFIFDKFFKGENSADGNINGSGLGLAIVKSILDAHGKEIYVDSEPNKFCSFSFCLEKA